MKAATKDELTHALKTVLEKAGGVHVMTKDLMSIIVEHSAGNYRVMMIMANELLAEGESLGKKSNLMRSCFLKSMI